jgi:hypothetical protein
MGKVIKLRRFSEDMFARERRLRRSAKKNGYELVNPWRASDRNIPGQGPYILVPHHSGLSLDEVEEILTRYKRQRP